MRRQGFIRTPGISGLLIVFGALCPGLVVADFGVQVGTFARSSNAERMLQQFRKQGFPVLTQSQTMKNGRTLIAVIVGPYPSQDEALGVFRKLTQTKQSGFVRRVEKIDSPSVGSDSSAMPDNGPSSVQLVRETAETPLSQANSPPPGNDGEVLVFHEDAVAAKTPAENDSEILIFHDQEGAKPVVTESSLPEMKKETTVVSTNLRAEAGGLFNSDSLADSSHYLHADVTARWNPVAQWEFQLAARVDGYYQEGTLDDDRTRLDYGETFVRFRGDDVRVTAGSQNVVWGRIDEVAPTDRLSVQDLSRFILDDLSDRRRAVPALRMELFRDVYKLDALWIPSFREAELPGANSVWSPIDKIGGRLRGVPENAVLSQFVTQGTFGTDITGSGGGLRFSRSGEGLDYALTVQRFRHSGPYYELNPTVRASYLGGNPVATAIASTTAATFTEKHPQSWLYGGDIAVTTDKVTWRFEAAYLSDVPATTTDFRMITLEGFDWMGGAEFYPGGGDTRVNLQLGGRHLLDAPAIYDRKDIYNFNGEIERVFANSRWRVKGRFSIGLDEKDIYINPELAYLGFEPHEFYVSLHYFDGNSGTFGGFHQNDSMLTLGWRARY